MQLPALTLRKPERIDRVEQQAACSPWELQNGVHVPLAGSAAAEHKIDDLQIEYKRREKGGFQITQIRLVRLVFHTEVKNLEPQRLRGCDNVRIAVLGAAFCNNCNFHDSSSFL